MSNAIRNTLLAGSAAVLLSAGAAVFSAGGALAAPATAQSDLNVRSGPGTQYQVVGTIQAGETVDAGNCAGSWCQVSFSGGSGYASRNHLAMAGGAAGPAVAATPYVYGDDYAYDDDYGYSYGPSVGIYAGPRFHRGWHGRTGWQGNRNAGNWHGNRGGNPNAGNAGASASGFAGPPRSWQRPGSGIGAGGAMRSAPVARTVAPSAGPGGSGFAGPPRSWQRPGSGIGAGGAMRSAPVAGTVTPSAGAAPAPSVGAAGSGFAGSMVRGGK